MNATGTGSATAKAILMGEHFVVHGSPALAVPVPQLNLSVTLAPAPEAAPLEGHLGHCVATALAALDAPADLRVTASVTSSIPVGSGLGSSAALSLAVARAAAALLGRNVGLGALRDLSLACERAAHGRPSGVDTEVCLTGLPVFLDTGRRFLPLAGGALHRLGLIVMLCGAGGATVGMIERVAAYRAASPERFEALAAGTAERTTGARAALLGGDVDALGRLMTEQHAALREIGVSTGDLDAAVAAARDAGAAGAKVSGAGGGGAAVAVVAPARVPAVVDGLRQRGVTVLAAGPLAAAG
jgi:mevalonate kinase